MSAFLVHIGLPKTGSTLLQTWFGKHPQLLYTRSGLGGFGSTQALCAFVARDQRPKPKCFVTSDESFSVVWDDSVSHLHLNAQVQERTGQVQAHQAQMCDLLHELFPAARLLLVTRGFESYLLSTYSEYLKLGGTLALHAVLEMFSKELQSDLDMDYLVRLYRKAFGAERVLTLPYELLRDDLLRFLGTLEHWLQLDHYECQFGRVNPSLSSEELYWYPHISNAVSKVARPLPAWVGQRIYSGYVRRYTQTNRLRPLIRMLNQRGPRQITLQDIPPEYLHVFQDKATLLRDNPLYAPYAADYLWKE
jgi:sulfotransferase family protein